MLTVPNTTSTWRVSAAVLLGVVLTFVGCDKAHDPQQSGDTRVESPLEKEQKAAEAGDAKAQAALGRRYSVGDGVPKDEKLAYAWFLKAADAGNAEGMWQVGIRLSKGRGVAKDNALSRQWHKKAAEAGHGDAQVRMAETSGFEYSTDGTYSVWFDQTEADLPIPQGQEKPKDEDRARLFVTWMTKAADGGHLQAGVTVARLFLFGLQTGSYKIERDVDRAVQLLRRLAEIGYWDAQWTLAILYQAGYATIPPDTGESAKWWNLLKAQSDPQTSYEIGSRYRYDPNPFIRSTYKPKKYDGKVLPTTETSNRVAAEWFARAVARGHKRAAVELAEMYENGTGVSKDLSEAFRLNRIAAEGNDAHPRAQWALGMAYVNGDGVAKDYGQAKDWFLRLTNNPDSAWHSGRAKNALGILHERGWGVEKDLVLAYAWLNLAAAGEVPKSKENLARIEKQLSPPQIREAQALSSSWTPGLWISRNGADGSVKSSVQPEGELKLTATGTGFYIGSSGQLLTNNHVAGECKQIRVPASNVTAKLVVADKANDLAIAATEGYAGPVATFPTSDESSQGEEIYVFGYPLEGYLPSAGNITPGIISALAGPGNNASLIQITAPVQPGNSGGPVLNKKGSVVGVVVGKADAIGVAKATGDIPQNINFAISGRTVKSFLDGNKVTYQVAGGLLSFSKSSVEIADQARQYSVKIECWR